MNWGYVIFLLLLAIGIAVLIDWIRKRLRDKVFMYVLITKLVYPIVLIKKFIKKVKRWIWYVPLKRFVIIVGYLRTGLMRIIWRMDRFIDWYGRLLIRLEEEKD